MAHEGDEPSIADLDFSLAASSAEARQPYKKRLPGIINLQTDGEYIYALVHVQQGYQWALAFA